MAKAKGSVAKAAGGLRVPAQTMEKLSALNFAPYNPRTISAEKMASLKASLAKHGMVLNLVVQRASPAHGPMVIIGGHQRVTAMRELCAERGWPVPEEVPCTVLAVGDAEAKQLNVALNNIEGEFDPYKLGAMFADIRGDMTMDDVLATGFLAEEIDQAVLLARPPDEEAAALEAGLGELEGFGASITLSVEFETVEQRDEAKELLRAAAKAQGKKAGALVIRALRAAQAAGKLPRHPPGNGKGDDRRAGAGKKERVARPV